LSRPGLRPSSPRALPAPIVRRRSEAFDLLIAQRRRYVRATVKDRVVNQAQCPRELGGRDPSGPLFPDPWSLWGPSFPVPWSRS